MFSGSFFLFDKSLTRGCTYGHDLGDFVLKSISEDMTKAVRENDMVARFGGDEFVIILKQTSEQAEIQALADRVEQAIAKPRTDQGVTLTIRASIGVALYPDDANSMKHLIKRADKAMYDAKKVRENGIHYASENPNKS
jgi:diguanylate cyclase (GGDEF)-like protein